MSGHEISAKQRRKSGQERHLRRLGTRQDENVEENVTTNATEEKERSLPVFF